MDPLLDSVDSAISSVSKIISEKLSDELISDASENGISLLSLKNFAMLSYIQNLAMLIGARIQQDEEAYNKFLQKVVTQRVVLEKGIKGLESKISYQLEKVIRAHLKDTIAKEQEEEQAQAKALAGSESESSEDDDESSSDEEEDELNYRPQPARLNSTSIKKSASDRSKAGASDRTKAGAKYQAPKLAPAVPFSDKKEPRERKSRNTAVEEYIRETANAPIAEPSIGSTIMDHGRGGERTERDRRKLKEVQQYEEENFTRLPGLSKKQEKKAARQRQSDAITKSFFGEDWSFLDKSERAAAGAKRKKPQKPGSSKKRR